MAVTWRNNGERDAEGNYVVDVDPENGTQVQTFYAKTRKELTEQIAEAQFSASRTIHELKQERTPDRKGEQARIVPKPLTADERMQMSVDIGDPTKFDDVVNRVIQAKYGDLDVLTSRENARIQQETDQRDADETRKWMAANPDWYPSEPNKKFVFDYIENNQLDVTSKNLGIAWDLLKSSGKADLKPAEQEPLPPANDGRRPRLADANYSTGVQESEISRIPPTSGRKPKLTWDIIDRMGRREYERRLREESGFMAQVDALPPRA